MLKWTGENPHGSKPTQRTIDNQRMLRVGKTVSRQEDYTSWLPNYTKWLALKSCIQVTLHRPSRLYLGIYMYLYYMCK